MLTNQVKSKDRVANHGEVFTNEREVNAMLDLVKSETERIESKFLEPACGNGNFLAEILRRKLKRAKEQSKFRGKIHPLDYEKKSLICLCSIYGVELLQDNVDECVGRLFDIWDKEYRKICKNYLSEAVRDIALYILKKNILCGDTLHMTKDDGSALVFSEWEFMGENVRRRDYSLKELLDENIRSDAAKKQAGLVYDPEIGAYMPTAIKDYPLINYRRLNEYE